MGNSLKNRRFQLESLEERTLLAVDAGFAAAYNPSAAADNSVLADALVTVPDATSGGEGEGYGQAHTITVKTEAELTGALANVEQGGIIQLGADIDLTATMTVTDAMDFTLDLAGYTLARSSSVLDDFSVITNAGTLTIIDSSETETGESTGKITNGTGFGTPSLTGRFGGGIYNTGYLTFAGGNITGNSATFKGGGIYNCGQGTVVMTGGTISGNSAGWGGGIYNYEYSGDTLIMTGGTITENSAVQYGGGVFSGADGAVFTVGGTAVIDNNLKGDSASNLHIQNHNGSLGLITISTETPLAEGAKIGITYFGNVLRVSTNGSFGDEQYFSADAAGKAVNYDSENGYLKVVNLWTVTKSKFDEEVEGTLPYAIKNAAACDVIQFADGIGMITFENQLTIDKAITIDGGRGMAFYGNQSSFFNIDTVSGTVVIKMAEFVGGNDEATSGGALYINSSDVILTNCGFLNNSSVMDGGAIYCCGSTLTVNNGLFVGSKSEGSSGGGAIYVLARSSDTAVTLNNCTLTGNQAEAGGSAIEVESVSAAYTVVLNNCIVVGNTGSSMEIDAATQDGSTFTCNNVLGTAGAWSGVTAQTETIEYDSGKRLFTDPGDWDYSIVSGSQAVDAGDSSLVPSYVKTDIIGNPRVNGDSVDLGCYELATVTMTVTSTADDGTEGTLRWAIENGGDIILFDDSLSGQTITLTSELVIYRDVTIDASSLADGIAVSGGGEYRVLTIGEDGQANALTVVLKNLTLTNGKSQTSGGALYTYAYTNLTMTDCKVTNNNTVTSGTIYVNYQTQLTMTNCLLTGNIASNGSVLFNFMSNVTMTNCTIAGNGADHTANTIEVTDGTATTLYNCILVNNKFNKSSGTEVEKNGNTVNAYNTLSAYTDWSNAAEAGNGNIVYDSEKALFAADSYQLSGTDSQAYNLGENSYITETADLDGYKRVMYSTIDMGAYEYQYTVSAYTGTYDKIAHTAVTIAALEEGAEATYTYGGKDYTSSPEFTDAGEYAVTVTVKRDGFKDFVQTVTCTIAKRELYVTGTTVEDKCYNGATDAVVNCGTLDSTEIISGDSVSISSYSGTFADPLPGEDKSVTVSYVLDNSNYFVADETKEAAIYLLVTTSEDIADPQDDVISLREAISCAEEIGAVSAPITFDAGIETVYIADYIEINSSVIISGTGITFTMKDEGIHGAFKVKAGSETAPVVIKGGTFTGFNDCVVKNIGYLLINGTQITNNTSDFATSSCKANGTAVNNEGTALIDNAYIAGNSSVREGEASWGAVYNTSSGLLAISNSVIAGNYAGCGSALANAGGTMVVYNCTVAGNWSWYNNGATYGEAIFGYDGLGIGGITLVYNTISVDNVGGSANIDLNTSYTGEDAGFVTAPSYEGGQWNADAWKGWDLRLTAASEACNIGDNAKAKTAADSSVLIEYDLAGEDRVCGDKVDAGAYEYTVSLTGYEGTFDGQSHFGVAEITAPTGTSGTYLYSTDGENWSDDPATVSFRNAGTYDVWVWVANDYADYYLQTQAVISPLQLTVEGSWVEPNLPGSAEAWVHVGTVETLYDDVTVTAAGTFQSTELGKNIPVDVQYQVSGDMAGNYIAPVDEVLYGDINEAEEASMVVTTLRDVVNAADGLISLREALTVYYGTDGCTTVTFAAGLEGTITVDSQFAFDASYEGLVIDGAGKIVFDGQQFTVFTLSEDANITFKGLTFQNITSAGDFGAAFKCGWGCQGGSFDAEITFDSCKFLNNKGGYGGAVLVTGVTGVFSNCTFTNNSGANGGAIWNSYGNLKITDCTFTGNSSANDSTGGAINSTTDSGSLWIEISGSTFANNTSPKDGGAIYTELSKLTITDSVFTGNSGANGGAICATHWAKFTQDLSPVVITISGTTFDGNTAKGNGGAITATCPQFTIDGCTFVNNTAAGDAFSRAGAIYTADSVADSKITNTAFQGNAVHGTMSSMGGALFLATTGWVSGSNYVIEGCDFIDNAAGANALYYGFGGAGYVAGTTTFRDCSFTGNSAYIADDNNGGGEVKGGALYITAGSDKVQLWNCTVADNYAGGNAEGSTAKLTGVYGAGVYANSAVDFVQCLIADNTLYGADGHDARGAGIAIGSVPVTIWHSTVAGNTIVGGDSVGGGIYSTGAVTALYSIVADNEAATGADLCNKGTFAFQGSVYNAAAIDGDYTTDEACVALQDGDALFAADSYKLAPRSVAIDSTGVTKAFDYTEDLAGDPRLRGFFIDAGCFEFQGADVYVCVTFSDKVADMEESADLPESIDEVAIGSTVYAQIWVKNVDGSTAGITGGYVDFTYDADVFDIVNYSTSGLFQAHSDLASDAVEGLLATFGGNTASGQVALGVDSWALLGTIELVVSGYGEGTADTGTPSFHGVPSESLNISRISEGAVEYDAILYHDAALNVVAPRIAAPTLTAVASNGANSQKASWTVVKDAAVSAYELAYTFDGTNWTYVQTTSLSATISGLTYGSNVTYKVRALSKVDAYRDSEWSNEITLNVCPMDIDGDGFIGASDFAILTSAYFTTAADAQWKAAADIDGDGLVGPGDVSYLYGAWGKSAGDEDLVYPAAKAADEAFASVDEVFTSLDVDDLEIEF